MLKRSDKAAQCLLKHQHYPTLLKSGTGCHWEVHKALGITFLKGDASPASSPFLISEHTWPFHVLLSCKKGVCFLLLSRTTFLFCFRARSSSSPVPGTWPLPGRCLSDLAASLPRTARTRAAPRSCCAPQSRPTASAASSALWPGGLLQTGTATPKAGGPSKGCAWRSPGVLVEPRGSP